jgi:hypothetical protein
MQLYRALKVAVGLALVTSIAITVYSIKSDYATKEEERIYANEMKHRSRIEKAQPEIEISYSSRIAICTPCRVIEPEACKI